MLCCQRLEVGWVGRDPGEHFTEEHGHDQWTEEGEGMEPRVAAAHLAPDLSAGDESAAGVNDRGNDRVVPDPGEIRIRRIRPRPRR